MIYFQNEGIEEKVTIQVCLDPNNQMEDCQNDAKVYSNGELNTLFEMIKPKMLSLIQKV